MKIEQSKVEQVFNLVSEDGTNVKIVMGNNVVSDKIFETEKDAEKYIASKPYELIFNAIILFAQYVNKENYVNKESSNEKRGKSN